MVNIMGSSEGQGLLHRLGYLETCWFNIGYGVGVADIKNRGAPERLFTGSLGSLWKELGNTSGD